MTLVCTVLPIFEAGKTKQTVNKQKLWPFLLSSVCSKHLFCFASNSPPKNRQASNNQKHSQFFFYTVVALFWSHGISIILILFKTFFLFQRRRRKKKKKAWHAPLITRKSFFPHVSFCVLCYAEMFVSGEWIHMFLTPVTAPLLEALLTHNYSWIRINGTDGKILELFWVIPDEAIPWAKWK